MSTPFSWQTLRAIVGGRSALDLPRLDLRSTAEADDFLLAYGFDTSHPAHRRELEIIRRDALAYIRQALLPPPSAVLPEVAQQEDLRQLLLWASRPPETERQRWSCALLRVMHARAHLHSHLQDRYGPELRRQILDRFRPHLRRGGGRLSLGEGPDAVGLVHFEMKPEKHWVSTLTKLLHKPENVAAAVFDHIGVRFITEDPYEALRVVYYLRAHNVVMFANIKPTRSRNTLVDIEALEGRMAQLSEQVRAGQIDAAERSARLRRACRELLPGAAERGYNPASDGGWRSIQFTSRQLIRVPEGRGEARFFFPYEVQILDRSSWEAAASGEASHAVYKARQREAVRRRVLGALLGD